MTDKLYKEMANGKIATAFVDENNNVLVSRELVEELLDTFNKGYKCGVADATKDIVPNFRSECAIRHKTSTEAKSRVKAEILNIIREGEPTDIGRRITLERIYDVVKEA